MLRFAVVDDEINVAGQTEQCILSVCGKIELNALVDVFCSGEEILNKLKNGTCFHIIFLDIEMGACSGIEVSRYLRDCLLDEMTQIVYVSGKNCYDRQLFEFRPFYFLEKPVDDEKMSNLLKKYVRIYGEHQDLFEYKAGYDTHFVKINEILYFESLDRKIKIKTTQGEEIFYGSIQKVAEELSEKGFFMPHKSFLVNYRFLKMFGKDDLLLVNGAHIPVAKGKRKEIAKVLIRMENGGRVK